MDANGTNIYYEQRQTSSIEFLILRLNIHEREARDLVCKDKDNLKSVTVVPSRFKTGDAAR